MSGVAEADTRGTNPSEGLHREDDQRVDPEQDERRDDAGLARDGFGVLRTPR